MHVFRIQHISQQLWIRLTLASLATMSVCSLFPSLAVADELDEIQSAREAAEMKYVNELATGKYKSADARESLRAKILEPQEKRAREYFKSISQQPPSRKVVTAEEIDLKKSPKKDLSETANQSTGPNAVTGRAVSTSSGVPASEKAPLRPEFVLDGSNVPKEVVFESRKPSPSPSPSPSRIAH
jgi:hypothetical protein